MRVLSSQFESSTPPKTGGQKLSELVKPRSAAASPPPAPGQISSLPSSDSFLQVKHDIQPGTEKAGQFSRGALHDLCHSRAPWSRFDGAQCSLCCPTSRYWKRADQRLNCRSARRPICRGITELVHFRRLRASFNSRARNRISRTDSSHHLGLLLLLMLANIGISSA